MLKAVIRYVLRAFLDVPGRFLNVLGILPEDSGTLMEFSAALKNNSARFPDNSGTLLKDPGALLEVSATLPENPALPPNNPAALLKDPATFRDDRARLFRGLQLSSETSKNQQIIPGPPPLTFNHQPFLANSYQLIAKNLSPSTFNF